MKETSTPPQLPLRFLRWFCREDYIEEIEGDLTEVFRKESESSLRWAKWKFVWSVIRYFRPEFMKSLKNYQPNTVGMYKSYFKIGWRNLAKNKLFSLINISGMAISIASFLLIMLFVYDELQFDKHVEHYSQKYRVFTEGRAEDGSLRKQSMIPPMIAPTAAAEFPEIESYTRFLKFNFPILFGVGDKKLTERKGGYADATIFDMFSLKLLEGDARTALKEPNTIAISHTLKQKYFGDKPAFGEQIVVGSQANKVTAVFEDFSSHSHLQLDYFLPMEEFIRGQPQRMQRWTWSQFHTYIKLKEGTDIAALEKKMGDMVIRNTESEQRQFLPRLMPVEKIHLHAYDHLWDIAVRGNIQTFYILLATALFIIIIAILNFINLSTARAVNRVKEVGVRKVIGAFRTQLISQFISESVIIAVIALILGGALASLTLPHLNVFTEKNIPLNLFMDPFVVVCLVGFALLMGVAAGAYPAFYVSGYNPVRVLSGRSSGQSGKTLLRKGLVVFQFMLSFFLIIAATVVSDQHTYMRTAKMGFDKDNQVIVQLRGDMRRTLEATKQSFLDHPGIISGSMGYGLPGEAFAGDGIIDKVTNKEMGISMLTVDHDYVKTLGLEIIAGRDFSKEFPADEKNAFLVSERAAEMLGYDKPEDAIGHAVAWNRWDAPDSLKEGKVIGVVKDIQLNSMRETINPVILHVFPFAYNTLTMKVHPDNVPSVITHLENTWKSFNTEWPFEYRFLDENFDRMYKSEEKLATLFTLFTTFTIFVACLGLFGLVVYSTSQKYKEISIRKILGAREVNIVLQLGKSYMLLIVIAFIVAIPVSYYAAYEWLQKFAFRIPITPLLFIKTGLFIIIISILTVGIQSLKAARANPVDALKEQ
ncbi:MAG: ABC transporter permease [Cyclobacteriaceae bacterium]|nr:ABC transporter permease [Cyclobacteriaceae bacterium]